jgi:hypothetical protein
MERANLRIRLEHVLSQRRTPRKPRERLWLELNLVARHYTESY